MKSTVTYIIPFILAAMLRAGAAGFAPDSIALGSDVSFSGTATDQITYVSSEGGSSSETETYADSRSLRFVSENSVAGGTYSFTRTGPDAATLRYTVPDNEGGVGTETGNVSLVFTSANGGTYSSSGTFQGTYSESEGGQGSYSGTFTGSGTFSYNPPLSVVITDESNLTYEPQSSLSEEIKLTNQGHYPASGYLSIDAFPGVRFFSYTGEKITLQPGHSRSFSLLSDTIGDLPNVLEKGLGQYQITVRFDQSHPATMGFGVHQNTAIQVTDRTTGLPIEGARVTFEQASVGDIYVLTTLPNGKQQGFPGASENGYYRWRVYKAGYLPLTTPYALFDLDQSASFSAPLEPEPPDPPGTPVPDIRISDLPDITIYANQTIPPIAFTIDSKTRPEEELTVTATSSNTALLPNANLQIGGSAAERTLSILSGPSVVGTTRISVEVTSNPASLGTRESFVLHVLPAPAEYSDNFNDNLKSPEKWGADLGSSGTLSEVNGRLEFSATAADRDLYRPWILNPPGYDKDWETVIDVSNLTSPSLTGSETGIGIAVFSPTGTTNRVETALYAYRNGTFIFNGVYAGINGGGETSSLSNSTVASLRITYKASTKVIACFHDPDGAAGGYTWNQFASYGIAGTGGATANRSWGMSGSQAFRVAIWAYGDGTTVPGGLLFADNFIITGPDTPLVAWKRLHFINPALTEAASAIDHDKDGITNLQEFAFNMNPTTAGTSILTPGSGTSGLPVIQSTGGNSEPRLRLEYIRRKASTQPGIAYLPQFSTNLTDSGPGSWETFIGNETVHSIDATWERVIIEDTDPGGNRRFARVKVATP
ncbi:MAG: hypothetical protein KF712_06525 [Akkermansiaceae bacterium]|nr:hypothetical protein [Akkermansiaceae bacterium]